jgi:hypothetical protein
MKKDPKKLSEEIHALVSELAALAGVTKHDGPTHTKTSPGKKEKDKSGATGGIRILVDEAKLDSPKMLPEIMELLKQEGRHYSVQTVSMGLLNLVRERVLTRFRDNGEKHWKYAVRR